MAPTVEVDNIPAAPTTLSTSPDSSSISSNVCEDWCVEVYPRRSSRDPFDVQLELDDFDDNSCETYFCSKDFTPSPRSVIPEASPAFREAMGKMKLERTKDVSYSKTTTSKFSSPSSSSSSSSTLSSSPSRTSTLTTSGSRSKASTSPASSSSKYLLSPNPTDCPATPSSKSKSASSKRPASFGGSDMVKPRQDRRGSHCEGKRVSWADERGSDHQLISVRLIRPRLSMDTDTSIHRTPGQSILRNSGTR